MELKSYLRGLKSQWVLLIQAAAFVSLTIKGFVSTPTYFDPIASGSETTRLAGFIVALIVAIFFYLGHRWSFKKNAKGWVVATIVLAVLLVVAAQFFSESKARCSCRYGGEIVAIGTEYTDLGKQDSMKYPEGLPCEDSLMNFGGKAARIWSTQSISSCQRKLTLGYLATYITAALSMLSALQILRCYKAPK